MPRTQRKFVSKVFLARFAALRESFGFYFHVYTPIICRPSLP